MPPSSSANCFAAGVQKSRKQDLHISMDLLRADNDNLEQAKRCWQGLGVWPQDAEAVKRLRADVRYKEAAAKQASPREEKKLQLALADIGSEDGAVVTYCEPRSGGGQGPGLPEPMDPLV